jgi:carboxyl-terminal processing protease
MEEVVKKAIKKERKKHILITSLTSVFFFVVGCVSSVSLHNYIYGGTYAKETLAFQEAYSIIKNEWYFGTDELAEQYLDEGIEGLVNGYVSGEFNRIDPYLTYYPYEEVTPTYGLGIEVLSDSYGFPFYDGYFYIQKVYGYSSAHGVLQEGDLLSKVNGESIRYKNISEFTVRGEKDTEVTISYIRDGKEYDATLKRKDAIEHSVERSLYDNYAILKIDEFTTTNSGMKGTADLAEQYLKEIKKENISNLIIDLRDNPGGYVSAFKALAELFIPKGKSLGTYIDKNKVVIEDPKTKSDDDYVFDEIIILINENSASAAEAFTFSMKDNLSNVTVVGTKSYGKGIAQRTITLSNKASLRYTYAEHIRPNGNVIHNVGITPDKEIPLRSILTVNPNDYIVEGVLNNEDYGKAGKAYYDDKINAYQEQLDATIALLG